MASHLVANTPMRLRSARGSTWVFSNDRSVAPLRTVLLNVDGGESPDQREAIGLEAVDRGGRLVLLTADEFRTAVPDDLIQDDKTLIALLTSRTGTSHG
ncbi:hypothetical protein [Kibdelosporangium aridum]|uniref:hypothetical protein n=1 Tax=Kibdelosporangium aridum TaxID=2030 RepID=UPI0035EDA5AB